MRSQENSNFNIWLSRPVTSPIAFRQLRSKIAAGLEGSTENIKLRPVETTGVSLVTQSQIARAARNSKTHWNIKRDDLRNELIDALPDSAKEPVDARVIGIIKIGNFVAAHLRSEALDEELASINFRLAKLGQHAIENSAVRPKPHLSLLSSPDGEVVPTAAIIAVQNNLPDKISLDPFTVH